MEENKISLTPDGDVLITTAVLAKVLETSPKSIAAWHKSGMPKVRTGWWSLHDVLVWRGINSKIGDLSDQARRLRADADYRESKAASEALKLAVEEGRFLPAEEISADLRHLFMVIKRSLMAMGHNVAVNLSGIDRDAANEAKRIVDSTVYDVLTNFYQGLEYTKKKVKGAK